MIKKLMLFGGCMLSLSLFGVHADMQNNIDFFKLDMYKPGNIAQLSYKTWGQQSGIEANNVNDVIYHNTLQALQEIERMKWTAVRSGNSKLLARALERQNELTQSLRDIRPCNFSSKNR